MVVTAPSTPSSLAGPSAQGRSASRIASDGRGATEVFPENDAFGRLEHHHSDRRVATTCIGRARPHHGGAHPGRRRFSGQTRTGRYCRARYYHPGLQRLISEDPFRFADGDLNLYAYVRNTPTKLIDPLGLWVTGNFSANLGGI
jgi:RHS repeat-associated protein